MSLDLSVEQLVSMLLNYVNDVDVAQNELEQALHAEADAERDYRLSRLRGWEKLREADIPQLAKAKEDWIDAYTRVFRHNRDTATGNAKAAMEKVRNKRQQLSAVQSAANSVREEAALARVGPGP